MADEQQADRQEQAETFARQAEEPKANILVEFRDFLLDNKKWWLIPIIVVLVLVGLLVLLSSNPATAPFIYTF